MINKRLQFGYKRVYLVQIKNQKCTVHCMYMSSQNSKHAAGTSHQGA